MRIFKSVLLVLAIALLQGCDTGLRQMSATEYGVVFRALPKFLGGGYANDVIRPGETVIVWPWDSVYRIDTALKYVSWGQRRNGDPDFVHTRALDGNEVALAVTVQYRVGSDTTKLVKLVQEVGTTHDKILEILVSVARAYIRSSMNELKTAQFFQRDARYQAISKVKDHMSKMLAPYGIDIEGVIFDEHRFERVRLDGTVDTSYQQKIDETQKLREDTERERLRVDTIRAKKMQELNDTQAQVNRTIAEADGYRNQAKLGGDGYFAAKQNDAQAILSKGRSEAEGLKAQVEALAGPGGQAILKLEMVKQLMRDNPKFVVVGGDSKGASIDLKRLDTNQLLTQIGIVDAMRIDPKPEEKTEAAAQ